MITTKTVLVLGAGASAPYGFPVGSDFVSSLGSVEVTKLLHRAGVGAALLSQFSKIVATAQSYSIDEFLENRPEFRDVGRMAIVARLLPAERKSLAQLNDLSKPDHWYRYLKARLVGPYAAFKYNNLRIRHYSKLTGFRILCERIERAVSAFWKRFSLRRTIKRASTPCVHT